MKKNIITFVCFVLIYCNALAQFPQNIFNSPNQQMVEQAIDNGIIIIKQSYQLEDSVTHQRYGRYGNEEFGQSISLAVKVKEGIIVNGRVLRPWIYDENYARYKESLRPVLFKTEVKELSDSTFHVVNLPIDSIPKLHAEFHYLPDSTLYKGNGYDKKTLTEGASGWLIWVTSNSKIEECNSTTKTAYTIYKYNLQYSPDLDVYAIEQPNIDHEIWGGIYVIPEQDGIGRLSFKIAGCLTYSLEQEWKLVPLTIKANTISEVSANDKELTPLDKTEDTIKEETPKKVRRNK